MKTRIEKKFSGTYLYIKEDKEIKYDITGFESLSQIYASVHISLEDLIYIVDNLAKTGKEIDANKMDINGLLLGADFVFAKTDLSSCMQSQINKKISEILFIYFPYKTEYTLDYNLSRLSEFIIDRIDYNDERAVKAAYSFYMQIYKGNYVFDTSLWK